MKIHQTIFVISLAFALTGCTSLLLGNAKRGNDPLSAAIVFGAAIEKQQSERHPNPQSCDDVPADEQSECRAEADALARSIRANN